LLAVSEITFPIFDHIKAEITINEEARKLVQSIRQGNSHQHGHLRMASSSTNSGYIFPLHPESYRKYSTPSMILHMRDLKKHYIDSAKLSTLRKLGKQFNSLLVTT
jgi:hypothetical protein